MFKVNNKDTRATQWRRSGVFIANVEDILHLVLSCSFVDFEQLNAHWKRAPSYMLY